MNHQQQFMQAVAPLLLRMGVANDVRKTGEVLLIKLDKRIDMALVGAQERYLSIVATLGELPSSAKPEILMEMLASNQFDYTHPPLILGLEPDSRNIILWTRLALAELTDSLLMTTFDRVLYAADALHFGRELMFVEAQTLQRI